MNLKKILRRVGVRLKNDIVYDLALQISNEIDREILADLLSGYLCRTKS
jgi:hypothetical protein